MKIASSYDYDKNLRYFRVVLNYRRVRRHAK